MPLKLVPPREGKSPNYTIRGTHFRIYIDRTAGTSEKRAARKVLDAIKRQIERGEYSKSAAEPLSEKRPATFADAALAYLKAGGDNKYISRIIEVTGEHGCRTKHLAISTSSQSTTPWTQFIPMRQRQRVIGRAIHRSLRC